MTELAGLLAAAEQLPEDVGKSGPLGLLLTVVLLIAVFLLVRSMTSTSSGSRRASTRRGRGRQVPDTPAELFEPRPGDELLDTLAPGAAGHRAAPPGRRRRPGAGPPLTRTGAVPVTAGTAPGARYQACATSITRRGVVVRLRRAGQGEHPERQPGADAEGQRRLALERAGPGDLPEGAEAGDVHDLPAFAGSKVAFPYWS